MCIAAVCAPVPSARAGSWPAPPGKGQIIQTNLAVKATKSFDMTGELGQPAVFSKYEAGVFWEHGLNEKTTLVVTSSYQDLNFRAGVDNVKFKGFGETGIGLRRVLWRDGSYIVSAQGTVIVAGTGEGVSDADLGLGSTQYEARILAGRSFKLAGRDGFIDGQAAWRFRAGRAPDEWRLDVSAGWHPMPEWQILAQTFYVDSQVAPGFARGTKRLKAQASLVYHKSERTSYQIGLYQTVLGENIVQEKALFISVWQRY
ncbi:MAG: hypothetical protein COA69_13315 [Robiginitomaculum sp.]|nr:MAG: hypothetical protein COA69_13315 [Robiginitomaculum sp.]